MKKEGESVDFTDCKIYAEVRMTNVSGEKVNNRAQDYYKMLLFLNESTNDTFLLWDMERDIVYFSRQLTVLIGQEYKDGVPDDIFAYKLEIIKDIVYRNDMPKVERAIRHVTRGTDERMDLNFRYVDKHGKKFWVNCRGNVLNEGGKEQPLMIGCLSRRVLSEKVDMLTGLMNYNKMLENVEKGIAKGKRGHMLILGIDDFREINQCMGRDYGNQVLKTVAEVLEEIKNEKSSVYRMDGDHFGVDLAGCSKRETVDFFERLQKRTESMCEFSGGAVCYPYNENEKDMKWLIILGGCLSLLLGRSEDCKELYVLLDRTSPGVCYSETQKDTTFVRMVPREWLVRQMLDTVGCYEKGICFTFDPRNQYSNVIERKHRSFLDSIRYLNEDEVRNSFPVDSVSWVYLLDEGTIKEDSIVIYRVCGGRYTIAYD